MAGTESLFEMTPPVPFGGSAAVEPGNRVAIVAPSFPPSASGGVSSSHYNLYLALKEHFEVRFFTFDDGAALSGEAEVVVRCGLPPFLRRPLRAALTMALRFSGARGVLFECCDALCGALAGMKVLRNLRDFAPDLVIVPDHGAVSALWPHRTTWKTIFISHHNSMRFHDQPVLGRHSKRDALLGRFFEQRAVDRADYVLCPSPYMAEIFRETYRFGGPVAVVPNLVGRDLVMTAGFPLHEHLRLPPGAPTIYIPSAGSIYKGRDFVLPIMELLCREYPGEIGFYLSGSLDQAFRDSLRRLPASARVYAPGPVPYHVNLANMNGCSLCISPCLAESFGMALLEAQLCGLPVVAFDAGGNREVVLDGKTGYLTRYLDYEELVERSLSLLKSDSLSAAMKRAAILHSRSRFNEAAISKQYCNIFSELTR